MKPRIAFQGERGAFSEQAAHQLYRGPMELLPCESFEKTFQGVVSGRADACVITCFDARFDPLADRGDGLAKIQRQGQQFVASGGKRCFRAGHVRHDLEGARTCHVVSIAHVKAEKRNRALQLR